VPSTGGQHPDAPASLLPGTWWSSAADIDRPTGEGRLVLRRSGTAASAADDDVVRAALRPLEDARLIEDVIALQTGVRADPLPDEHNALVDFGRWR
jgi:hypothetical protein